MEARFQQPLRQPQTVSPQPVSASKSSGKYRPPPTGVGQRPPPQRATPATPIRTASSFQKHASPLSYSTHSPQPRSQNRAAESPTAPAPRHPPPHAAVSDPRNNGHTHSPSHQNSGPVHHHGNHHHHNHSHAHSHNNHGSQTHSAQHGKPRSAPYHDLEAGHNHHQHHHQHHQHHHGNANQHHNPQAEQQVEQIRVYCLQILIFVIYLIYMIVLCGPLLYPTPTWYGITICVLFNIAFVLMTVAFWQCATMDPGEVPRITGTAPPNFKFCVKCHNNKPERTHHCSVCGRCVLNMDHHCPWLANCVGFHNRQFFLLILIYGVICTLTCTVHGFVYMFTTAPFIWPNAFTVEQFQEKALGMIGFVGVTVMLFFSLVLFIALVTFLRFHLHLVWTNATTLEATFNRHAGGDYDLGNCWMNSKQVFGERWYLWWCPIWREPLGDGYTWGQALLKQLEEDQQKHALLDKGPSTEMVPVRRGEEHRHR